MKNCLDEVTLQSYFDGELPIERMENATLHLSSCAACATLARELEEENAVLTTALAAEFEAPVPTEQLRRRIGLAVANVNAPVIEKSGFLGSLRDFFNFAPQKAFAYAGLIVVLAFAAIFGVIKMRSVKNAPPTVAEKGSAPTSTGTASNKESVAVAAAPASEPDIPKVGIPDSMPHGVVHRPANMATVAPRKPAPVKLIPGERTYLQTIAKLDSAIRADKSTMRPALQVEYERNLALVDRAIAATRTAAKNNPHDPDAADFMFAAYQSKVDLLNTIADARVGGRSH
jgi:anti-sigma factor RsiW